MRIALIAPETLPVPPVEGGAVQLYIDEVVRRLAKSHRVTLFSPGSSRIRNPYNHKRVRVIRLNKNYLRRVARKVKKSSFHIVHTFNRPNYINYLKKAAPKAKHVLNLHNTPFEHLKKFGWRVKKGLRKADFIVANSDFTRNDTLKSFRKVRKKQIQTVHLGIDPDKFIYKWKYPKKVKKWRRKLGVRGKQVVLFVGRVTRGKGIETLIEAGRLLKKRHKKLLILIVGGSNHGVQRENMKFLKLVKKARRKLGHRHVHFTGFVPPEEIAKYYACADVFVCPSRWEEPFGRVNLEAMASGVPIVATDRGGISESVRHKKTGYLVSEPDDARRLAKYIHKLLRKPSIGEKFARNGYKLVKRRFTWDSVVDQLDQIYRSLE